MRAVEIAGSGVVPEHPVNKRPERSGLLTEACGRGENSPFEPSHLGLGTLETQEVNHGGNDVGGPRRRVRLGAGVEDVVPDLESQTQIVTEALKGRAQAFGPGGWKRSQLNGSGDEKTRLMEVDAGEESRVDLPRRESGKPEIETLAADEPTPSRGAGEEADHAEPDGFPGARILGEDLERQGLQGVAHKDRRRLIERPVATRPSAPHVIVVHRRQIVVDERVGVHTLDGTRGGIQSLERESERVGGGVDQKGSKTLAAAQKSVGHGLFKTGGEGRARSQAAGQNVLETPARVIQPKCGGLHRASSVRFGR